MVFLYDLLTFDAPELKSLCISLFLLTKQTNPVAGLCFFNLVVFHQEKVEKQGDGW